jgi:hypothetical protein
MRLDAPPNPLGRRGGEGFYHASQLRRLMMTLTEFRKVTAHLAGERELLCAGAPVEMVCYTDDDKASVNERVDETGRNETEVVLYPSIH